MKKKKKLPTLEDVILELQPFSQELKNWCKNHLEFFKGLKNIYPEKFISPAVTIECKIPTGDIIIKVFTYHYVLNKPIFKIDYIVNIGGNNTTYILYTRNPSGSSQYVKDISSFFDKYEGYGYNRSEHHLAYEALPEELKERAAQAIELSEKLKVNPSQKIPQYHINRIYQEVIMIPTKDRFIKMKLKK